MALLGQSSAPRLPSLAQLPGPSGLSFEGLGLLTSQAARAPIFCVPGTEGPVTMAGTGIFLSGAADLSGRPGSHLL